MRFDRTQCSKASTNCYAASDEGDPAAAVIAEFPAVTPDPVHHRNSQPQGRLADRSGARRPLSDPGGQRRRYSRGAGLSGSRDGAAVRSKRRAGHLHVSSRRRHHGCALRSVGRRHRPGSVDDRRARLGVKDFASGATMAFRRADLGSHRRLRGDRRLSGRRLSTGPSHPRPRPQMRVERHHRRDASGWRLERRVAHQVRWARTVRVSKFWGYVGLPLAFATVWALALAIGRALGLGAGAAGRRAWPWRPRRAGWCCAARTCCGCGC